MTKKITKKNIVIKDKKTTSKKPATKSSSKKSKVVIKTKKNIKTTKPVVKAKSKTVKKPVPVVSKTKKVVAKASVKKTAVKVPTKKTKTTKKPVAPFSKTKKTVVKAKSKTVKKPVPVVSKTKKTFEEIFKSATKTIAKKAKAPIPVALPKAKTKVDKKLIAKSKKNIDKDEHNKTINDADLENKLTKIFNTKINKKQSGEVQIRLSTLLKETGNFLFTDDQIKHISKTLHDNNISVSGRCDKYNSPLSTYLTEHNVKTKSSNDNSNSNSIIKRMFKTLAASKPLSEDDEKKYIKMLGSKNELIRKNGREQLIISNLRLVASIARKHINKGVQLEDLILEGYLGLIKTVDRFDFNATTKFSTYAT
jgi:RNA polymerase primary sigma factor